MEKMTLEEFQDLRSELNQGVLDYLRSKDVSYNFAIMVLKDVIGYLKSDMLDNKIR